MKFSNYKNSLKLPELQSVIIESILTSCINGSTINHHMYAMQRILPLFSYAILKKYLFYLIDYELVSYNGKDQTFVIEVGGHDLLEWIKINEKNKITRSKDVVIIIE